MSNDANNEWRQEYATQGDGQPDAEEYPDNLPTNTGRVDGPHVIIDRCVVCGASHIHGKGGFVDGESTRAPHCSIAPDKKPTEYKIELEGGGSA